jgi:hypothetical protein
MKQLMFNNWRTTATGLVLCASAFVVQFHADMNAPVLLLDLARFVMCGGLAVFGCVAKDGHAPQAPVVSDVSNTNPPQ